MDLTASALMGAVQGLSEFLPVSSSAHIVFTSNFYKIFKHAAMTQEHSTQEIFLDIMLHFGTLIAVIIYFRKDIWEICKALWNALRTKNYANTEAKLGLYIIAGTIVTIILALPLEKFAAHLVFHPALVGGLLILTGGALFFSEYLSKKKDAKTSEVNLIQALIIGLAQGIAVLPGLSRSGWTIAAGLFLGLDRKSAARYSFLLSIPIILGASMVYPFIKMDLAEAAGYNWTSIIAGTVISGLVGYLCIKYFMKFISKFSLNIFGYYCVIMGVFTLIFFNIYK